MCRWGTHRTLTLVVDESVSYTGKQRVDDVNIDACIAELIQTLNDNGVRPVNSCCGHGKAEGLILLASGSRIYLPRADE